MVSIFEPLCGVDDLRGDILANSWLIESFEFSSTNSLNLENFFSDREDRFLRFLSDLFGDREITFFVSSFSLSSFFFLTKNWVINICLVFYAKIFKFVNKTNQK